MPSPHILRLAEQLELAVRADVGDISSWPGRRLATAHSARSTLWPGESRSRFGKPVNATVGLRIRPAITEYRPGADSAQPSSDVAAFRAIGVWQPPGTITISRKGADNA